MSVYLGDFVRTSRWGHVGRVYAIHHGCPEGAGWVAEQNPPIPAEQLADRKWVSVLLARGGAIVTPVSDCTVIDPVAFDHLWGDFYFRDAAEVAA
jgi:hypothetical protein